MQQSKLFLCKLPECSTCTTSGFYNNKVYIDSYLAHLTEHHSSQCSCQPRFHVHDNKMLTYLLTYTGLFCRIRHPQRGVHIYTYI